MFENESVPTVVTVAGKITDVKLLYLKAEFPMLVTEAGIAKLPMLLYLNAALPIVVKTGAAPKVKVFKPLLIASVQSHTGSAPANVVNLCPSKALSPMVVVVFGINNVCIPAE